MKRIIPIFMAVVAIVFTVFSWIFLKSTHNVVFLFCILFGAFGALSGVIGFVEEGGESHE